MKESQKITQILLNLPRNKRLFRINAGMGWTGTVKKGSGYVVIYDPRPFHGADKGWPDLCGWETIEITQDMVGKKFARFVAEEVKVSGRLSREQKMFRDEIERMGGIYRVIK